MQLKVGNLYFDIAEQPVKNTQLFLTSNRNIFCQGVFNQKWNLKPTLTSTHIQQKISAKKVSSLDLKGIKLTEAKEDPELQARREIEKQASKLKDKQKKKMKEEESEPTDSIKEMKKESRKRKTFTEEDEKKINAAKTNVGTVTKRRKPLEEELSLSEDYLEREEDEEEEEGDDDEDEDYKE